MNRIVSLVGTASKQLYDGPSDQALHYFLLIQQFYDTSTGGKIELLTLLFLNTICHVLANSVDPDQLASAEANWSGSALFVILYVNFYQKSGSSDLIGWKLEVGVAW